MRILKYLARVFEYVGFRNTNNNHLPQSIDQNSPAYKALLRCAEQVRREKDAPDLRFFTKTRSNKLC